MYFLQFCKYSSFWFPLSFSCKDFVAKLLHNIFHVGVNQINQNMVLFTIIDVYPHINLKNKGLSNV